MWCAYVVSDSFFPLHCCSIFSQTSKTRTGAFHIFRTSLETGEPGQKQMHTGPATMDVKVSLFWGMQDGDPKNGDRRKLLFYFDNNQSDVVHENAVRVCSAAVSPTKFRLGLWLHIIISFSNPHPMSKFISECRKCLLTDFVRFEIRLSTKCVFSSCYWDLESIAE